MEGEIKRFDVLRASIWAQTSVQHMLDTFPGLTVCRPPGNQFLASMKVVLDWFDDREQNIAGPSMDYSFKDVITKAKDFETVLAAELQTLATYHASQKGIYSTPDLIERAENTLPESVRNKLPFDVVSDLRESGKCLAFDTATASGFHVLRAVESVLHAYYLAVCKPTATKNSTVGLPILLNFASPPMRMLRRRWRLFTNSRTATEISSCTQRWF